MEKNSNVINVNVNGRNLLIDLNYHYHLVRLYDIEDIGDIINEIDSEKYYILVDKCPQSKMDYIYIMNYYRSEPSIYYDDVIYDECTTKDDYLTRRFSDDEVSFIWGINPEAVDQLEPNISSHIFLIKLNDEDDINEQFIEKCRYV